MKQYWEIRYIKHDVTHTDIIEYEGNILGVIGEFFEAQGRWLTILRITKLGTDF